MYTCLYLCIHRYRHAYTLNARINTGQEDDTHIHTHTHVERERKRKRESDRKTERQIHALIRTYIQVEKMMDGTCVASLMIADEWRTLQSVKPIP